MALIRDGILQQQKKPASENSSSDIPKPLEGFKILDVGCGGGILCEVSCLFTRSVNYK